MASTYFMLGTYSREAIEGISSQRTTEANEQIAKHGGNVLSVHALLGGPDLVIMAEFPGTEEAMKASLSLTRLTGISFSTHPAVSVDTFDRLASEL
ncbi:MAG: GYD domain-containing protein [Fidelibacterota bacterium]